MTVKDVFLDESQEFMTMGQFLKYVGLIGTGGQAKWFLAEETVMLNGTKEERRGKKLWPGDEIVISEDTYVIKKLANE